jgi:hypothetical protein
VSKYSPAEPGALRLLAPQGAFSQPLKAKTTAKAKVTKARPGHSPETVKLWESPQQSLRITLLI